MSRAKAWRRAALATYIAAGAALTLAGYTVATTAANANTLRDTRERIEDFQREQTAIAENSISAASVRRGTLPPDTRPPVAPDWPALAERAMPSVVALAGIDKLAFNRTRLRPPSPAFALGIGIGRKRMPSGGSASSAAAWPSKETRC
jgi:hypothetical protein